MYVVVHVDMFCNFLFPHLPNCSLVIINFWFVSLHDLKNSHWNTVELVELDEIIVITDRHTLPFRLMFLYKVEAHSEHTSTGNVF